MPKKILVILGQPQRHSYGGALMQAYVDGARAAGADVKELYLGEIKFTEQIASKSGSDQSFR